MGWLVEAGRARELDATDVSAGRDGRGVEFMTLSHGSQRANGGWSRLFGGRDTAESVDDTDNRYP